VTNAPFPQWEGEHKPRKSGSGRTLNARTEPFREIPGPFLNRVGQARAGEAIRTSAEKTIIIKTWQCPLGGLTQRSLRGLLTLGTPAGNGRVGWGLVGSICLFVRIGRRLLQPIPTSRLQRTGQEKGNKAGQQSQCDDSAKRVELHRGSKHGNRADERRRLKGSAILPLPSLHCQTSRIELIGTRIAKGWSSLLSSNETVMRAGVVIERAEGRQGGTGGKTAGFGQFRAARRRYMKSCPPRISA
jgi:hypothetical protein